MWALSRALLFGVAVVAVACGLTEHDKAESWNVLDAEVSANMHSIWGAGPRDLFIAGDGITRLH